MTPWDVKKLWQKGEQKGRLTRMKTKKVKRRSSSR